MIPVEDLKAWLGHKTWRTATARACHTCKATIAVGLDNDHCAFYAHVDPIPLTPQGEAVAVAAGLHTYTVQRTNSGDVKLTRRSHHRLLGTGRILGPYDVWPEHRCYQPHTSTTTTQLNQTGVS